MSEDYLQHYGVLGMKWGQHRARKYGGTYKYKSLRTKGYEHEAKRLASNPAVSKKDSAEAARRAKRANQFDKRMSQDSAKTRLSSVIAARAGESALLALGLSTVTKVAGYAMGAPISDIRSAAKMMAVAGAATGLVDASLNSKTYQQARVLGDGYVTSFLQAGTGYVGRIINEQRIHRRIKSNRDI